MEYQQEYSRVDELSELTYTYGVEHGSDLILFIKSGHGGNHRGYNDKYVKIAKNMREKYGCSVICASNPKGDLNSFYDDMDFLEKYADERGFLDFSIYFMGNSNGANQGLWSKRVYSRIKKMLFVNMPLMVNFHKTDKGMQARREIPMVFVYGDLDPSIKFIPFLELKKNEKSQIKVYEGANHNFAGKDEIFQSLPELLFLE